LHPDAVVGVVELLEPENRGRGVAVSGHCEEESMR
jgi:hypothetical protein